MRLHATATNAWRFIFQEEKSFDEGVADICELCGDSIESWQMMRFLSTFAFPLGLYAGKYWSRITPERSNTEDGVQCCWHWIYQTRHFFVSSVSRVADASSLKFMRNEVGSKRHQSKRMRCAAFENRINDERDDRLKTNIGSNVQWKNLFLPPPFSSAASRPFESLWAVLRSLQRSKIAPQPIIKLLVSEIITTLQVGAFGEKEKRGPRKGTPPHPFTRLAPSGYHIRASIHPSLLHFVSRKLLQDLFPTSLQDELY